jgi:hypothetical protein
VENFLRLEVACLLRKFKSLAEEQVCAPGITPSVVKHGQVENGPRSRGRRQARSKRHGVAEDADPIVQAPYPRVEIRDLERDLDAPRGRRGGQERKDSAEYSERGTALVDGLESARREEPVPDDVSTQAGSVEVPHGLG